MSETSAPGPVSAVPDRFSSTSEPVVGPGLSTPIDPVVDGRSGRSESEIRADVEFADRLSYRFSDMGAREQVLARLAIDVAPLLADLAEARAENAALTLINEQLLVGGVDLRKSLTDIIATISSECLRNRAEVDRLRAELNNEAEDVTELIVERDAARAEHAALKAAVEGLAEITDDAAMDLWWQASGDDWAVADWLPRKFLAKVITWANLDSLAAAVPTPDPLVGYSVWLDRESWGHVVDGLIAERSAAQRRKAINSESTSGERADDIAEVIRKISAADPLVPTPTEEAARCEPTDEEQR